MIYVCWDVKAVFYAIWSPFTFLVGYNDPRKPTDDLLHGERPPPPILPLSAHSCCFFIYPGPCNCGWVKQSRYT